MESSKEEPLIISVDAKGTLFLNIAEKPEVPIDERSLINQVTAALTIAKQEGH